jgi:phosphoglycolate phosphatase-like HAD superfamily hydrolase
MSPRAYRVPALLAALVGLSFLVLTRPAFNEQAQADPLPSWNDGPAKKALLEFVRATTEKGGPKYVPPEQRIATFDQDGTLWVEQPMYTQLRFALDRVVALAPQHPEWKTTEPFKSVLAGDREAMAKFTMKDFEAIVFATHAGMTAEEFPPIVKDWIGKARDPRWKRPYTDLVYQPMLEVMRYLRANGYRTCIVTGGGQDFVRTYAEEVYGIPPEQVIGSALQTEFRHDKQGKAILLRSGKLLLNDNFSGKPEDIHLFLGRRPRAAFGNSTGDREMLEYTAGGDGARLMLLVLHDDARREYAYGPAQGLPQSKVGTFTQELYDEAVKRGWLVVSMKNDWKRVFSFEE